MGLGPTSLVGGHEYNTPVEIALLCALIIAATFYCVSVFGFGGGIIAAPLLALLIGVHDAVALNLIFQFCTGLLVFTVIRDIDWEVAWPLTPGLLFGTIAGAFLLPLINVDVLSLILAGVIILFLIKSFFVNERSLGITRGVAWAAGTGTTGGLLQGLIGSGGPAITMYLATAMSDKVKMRATSIYLFFVANAVRLVLALWQGLFTTTIVQFTLVAMPFFLAAITLGYFTHAQVSDRYYRIAIYTILFFSAVSLTYKALS